MNNELYDYIENELNHESEELELENVERAEAKAEYELDNAYQLPIKA